ncbi:MAG: IS701 family transposase [Actinobacteria bacterium]|nr:IS701 family transposase [Actinomycetota bacterium]
MIGEKLQAVGDDLAAIKRWPEALEELHARLASRFRRPEVRERVRRYLAGLLGRVERKNSWQMAEQMGEMGPQGAQRLLNATRWDAHAVRDDLREYVIEHLGDEDSGVLIVDETGFLKKGKKSVGVARQYTGTAGKKENCQVGVFLAYASKKGAAFVDRSLYLPREWSEDVQRRAEAGVPQKVRFATKGELAKEMLRRAFEAQIPARWVVADTVYGTARGLRGWLEEQECSYVLAVPATKGVYHEGTQRQAQSLAKDLSAERWERVSAGRGSKGERLYDWACVALPTPEATKAEEHRAGRWLLVRRQIDDPSELAYYLAYGPKHTPAGELIRVAGSRWSIEDCFEQAKGEVGLDEYEVRKWESWYRHVTLSLLAHAYLTVLRSNSATRDEAGEKKGMPTLNLSR